MTEALQLDRVTATAAPDAAPLPANPMPPVLIRSHRNVGFYSDEH
jgi:hypothetical protein